MKSIYQYKLYGGYLPVNFKYIIAGVLIILVSLTQCTSTKLSGKEMNQEEPTLDTGQKVTVRNIYNMLVPDEYKTRKDTGDDTEFLDIRSEKGDVVIGYEIGVDDMTSIPKNTKTLNEEYEYIEKIKTLPEVNIWIAYKKTSAKFRNIEGRVYTEQQDEFSDLLRFSCSDTQLNNVQQILLTLKSI